MTRSRVEDERAELPQLLAEWLGAGGEVREIRSPYRICPIGAHIDHQGGTVIGMGIDAHTRIAFRASADDRCRIRSRNYPGEADFRLSDPAGPAKGWPRYAWAAARSAAQVLPAGARGIEAVVRGSLPGGGLSSSASVILAYVAALAWVNDTEVEPGEMVRRSQVAENDFIGLKSGMLDPASIVGARRDQLVAIDPERETWTNVSAPQDGPAVAFLVAFTGAERNLMATGFNSRVDECRSAASLLGERAGTGPADRLGLHGDEVFDRYLDELPTVEQRRARHFHGERRRVRQGIAAWERGHVRDFGRLMFESCESSISNFEVGSAELVALQEIFRETSGVLGARFSGAGFGGCAVALVESSRAPECQAEVAAAFCAARPELADKARFFLVESDDGVRLL